MRPPRHPAPAREPFVRDPVRLRAGEGESSGGGRCGDYFFRRDEMSSPTRHWGGGWRGAREAYSRALPPPCGEGVVPQGRRVGKVQLTTEGPPPVPAAPGHPPRKGEGRCRLRAAEREVSAFRARDSPSHGTSPSSSGWFQPKPTLAIYRDIKPHSLLTYCCEGRDRPHMDLPRHKSDRIKAGVSIEEL